MRIVLPVDGSRQAQTAVELVAQRAANVSAPPEVILLNVQPRVTGEVERLLGSDRLRTIREQDAQAVLKPALDRLAAAGLNAKVEVRVGSAGEQIAELAESRDADLVVMGARGLSEFQGLFLGSETSKVLASCGTPVLVVRDRVLPERGTPVKVGIAVDGSDYSAAAVRYVLHHTELFGERAEFTLINVIPDFAVPAAADVTTPVTLYSADEVAKMQERAYGKAMTGARELFGARGVPFREARLVGQPADEIARYAREQELDVLVLGSHGNGRFLTALLGSVAMRLAAQCRLPLLLIRRP